MCEYIYNHVEKKNVVICLSTALAHPSLPFKICLPHRSLLSIMKWSSQYITILKQHTEAWTKSKSKGSKDSRKTLLTTVQKAIEDFHESNLPEERLPDNLEKVYNLRSFICARNWEECQKISTWFQNNTKSDSADKEPEDKRGVRSYVRASTAKDAAASLYKDRVHDLIKEKTDSPSGSKDWISHYPAALSKVFLELDEEELERCDETMEEWNKNGPGVAQQKV